MTPGKLAELLRRSEDSTLEFKRDDLQNHDLAKELVALLNLAGSAVLLGVDDSGAIVGSTRDARNQTLVNVMRDYAYREARGMGIRNTIILGMRAHNGTAPELIAEEHRFIVRLFKGPKERIAMEPTDKPAESRAGKPRNYSGLLAKIKQRIRTQYAALKAANKQLVGLYWDIGRMIVKRQAVEAWGKSLVKRLSDYLQREFPGVGGFSARNLWHMRQFYSECHGNEKLQSLAGEIAWHIIFLFINLKR